MLPEKGFLDMRRVEEKQEEMQQQPRGQIIVVLAAGMVGLLVASGLAVDGGFLLMRQAQLERAVDIAALSGVTQMAVGGIPACNERAREFLSANGVQVEDDAFVGEGHPADLPGAYRYRVAVDWESEVFFMRIIGFDNVPLHAEAEAEYYPQVDIYTGSTMETGVLQSSNQSIFGPQLCSDYGDPITPTNSQWHNDVDPPGVYTYRIAIPSSYPYDRVRVEILDPDTYNQSSNSTTVERINFTTFNASCSNSDRKDACAISTGEAGNPFWFMRIDENRGTGTDGQCGEPNSYTASRNTRTLYRLFYLRQMPTGHLAPVDLAYYIGARDGGAHANAAEAAATDLMWVSPTTVGAERMHAMSGYGPAETSLALPQNCDTARATYRPEVTQPCSGNGDFIIELSELADVYVDPNTGVRFIYLQVQGLEGYSENGFEFWAGPPRSALQVPSNVNYRNLYVARYGASAHSSAGVAIYGIGRLPMNSNTSNSVDIPLTYFGPEYAGQTLYIQLFDADAGAQGPIYFRFDTIPLSDWAACYGDSNGACQGRVGQDRLGPDQIPNSSVWTNPPYTLVIPNEETDGIPFYGGRLIANYQAGENDTYSWRIVLESRPFLVE
jgi:hypothetical protein